MNTPARLAGLIAVAFALAVPAALSRAADSEDPSLRRARLLYKSGKYREAISELNDALKRNNENAEAYLWRGKAFARTSEFAKASKDLEDALKRRPENEEVYRELGATYLELDSRARAKGQVQDAADFVKKCDEVARKLLQRKPQEKESYEFLVRRARHRANLFRIQGGEDSVTRSQDELEDALRYCSKVLEIDPKDVSSHFDRLDILFSLRKYEECGKRCREVLKINSELHKPRLMLAQIEAALGRKEEAIKIYTEILQKKKTQIQALLSRAQLHLDMKHYEAALADANEVLRIVNKNPLANFIRGAVYMQLNKLRDAVVEFQQASTRIPEGHPFKVPAHFWLARCYLLQDKLQPAIEELNTVIKLDSRFVPARLILASSHLQTGYPDGAIAVLLDGLPFDPKNVELRRLLGIAYLHKQEYDQARSQFEVILKENPEGARPNQVLAGIALTEDRVDEAVQHCLRALKVEPKNVDVHFLLGLAYLRRNRLDGARTQFERVLELRGRHPGARMNLARVHIRLREFDLAQEQLQRCIEEDPSLPKPRYELIRLYVLQRKYDKAEDALTQLLKIEQDKAKVHLAIAELYRAKGEKDKALQEAQRALSVNPKLLAARAFMAQIHREDTNWAAALNELDAAIQADPKFAPGYEAAVIQVYLGRYDMAIKLFEKAASNEIQRSASLSGAAAAMQLKGDYRGALATLAQADVRKGQDILATLQEANIYLAQGDAANARTHIRQATQIPKLAREAYLGLIDKFADNKPDAKAVGDALTRIMFYGSRGWHTQAEQNCRQLREYAPENPFAYNVLADVYRRTGKAEKEIKVLQELIDVVPDNPLYRLRLGNLFLSVGRFKDARKTLEEAADVDPKDPEPRLALAYYFLRLAQHDLADEQALKVLAMDKNNAKALAIRATVLLAGNQNTEAKTVLESLVDVPGARKTPLVHIQLARLSLLEGKVEDALKHFEDAVEQDPKNIAARMGMADVYGRLGRREDAVEQYNEVLLLDSINAPALLRLAQIYRGVRRLDRSIEYAERAAKIAPSARNVLFELAAIHLARREFDEALAQFKKVLKERPDDVGAKVGIAEVLFRSGDHASAVQQLTNLLAEQRPLPLAQGTLVTFYKRLGEVDKAQAELESLRKSTRELLGAYDLAIIYIHKDKLDDAMRLIDVKIEMRKEPALAIAKAVILQLKGNAGEALTVLAEVGKDVPESSRLASFVANAHLALGKADAATKAIESVDLQAELKEAYLDLIQQLRAGDDKSRLIANALSQAALYADANWLTLARERYESLLQDEAVRGNLAILHLLANVYARQGEAEKAIASYEEMIRTRPNYEPALRQIATYHVSNNEPDKAVAIYRKLVQRNPDQIGYLLTLATALHQAGETQEAIRVYKDTIAKSPNNHIAYNNLAWLYAVDTKQLKEAEALASKAADLQPPDTAAGAAIRDTLGWIYYLMEDYDKALENATVAAEGMPGSAEVHYHLGMIYFRRNLRTSAVRHLTRALQLDPDFEHKAEVDDVIDRIRRRAR
jgi:tetratricopeptide (TPR) repeat protein